MKFKRLTICLFFLPLPLLAQKLEGTAVKVFEGDIFDFMPYSIDERMTIRVEGIDCPGKSQHYGLEAKVFTMRSLMKKRIIVKIISKDRYGRYIARVFFEDKNLSFELLKNGYARYDKRHSANQQYAKAEADAKKDNTGLWENKRLTAPGHNRDKTN